MTAARPHRAAAHATRAQFFCSGFLFATWGVHVPTVKGHYGIDEAALGLAMLSAGIGALAGLSQAGRLAGRHGPRRLALACGLTMAASVAALVHMPGYAGLLALLFVFGAAGSVFDVAINAAAAELELRLDRPLMSGMHGMFSLGGMAGALAGGGLLALAVPPAAQLAAIALAGMLAVGLAARGMLPRGPRAGAPGPVRTQDRADAGADGALRPGGRRTSRLLLTLGGLAALGLLPRARCTTGACSTCAPNWEALPTGRRWPTPASRPRWPPPRFCGDAVRRRIAAAALLQASALLAAAAMAMVLLTGSPAVALAGCALVGVGFANVVPVLFSAASQVPGTSPARAIARVSSLGYLGFMGGPPVIGFLAQHASLTGALWLVAAAAVVLAACARRTLGRCASGS
ncbi:MAG: MFS transporter [Xylophilus ampelinus]